MVDGSITHGKREWYDDTREWHHGTWEGHSQYVGMVLAVDRNDTHGPSECHSW